MRFFIYFFIFPLPFVISLVALLYVYDPFMIYHKPYFRDESYSDDMRIQAKGIIDNYDFDSYILGSSMLTWSSAKKASEVLGGKFVNISLNGSTFNEREVVLKYILKHKNPKHIIYSLDPLMLLMAVTQDVIKFDYLYDESFLNDFKIYYNVKFLFCALRYSTSEDCVGKKVELEKLMDWEQFNIKTFGGFSNWIKYYEDEDQSVELRSVMRQLKNVKTLGAFTPINNTLDIQKQLTYAKRHLFSIIEQYPNVRFSIIIPPYSRLYYRINNPTIFYGYAQILSTLIFENKSENIKFYGFDHLSYADNVANYKDLNHYYKDMNDFQLSSIADDITLLTKDNVVNYLRFVEKQIINYDVQSLLDEFQSSITSN
ncbi:hypothetical protein [Helicobacter ibis]|uniref:Uncharacterized protein n=3 Tax=Helicobacter TaxID=209 RepID=A0ABT4VD01_9HELI|nr:hypothetical protein [Helicobacter ibis]MDA3968581.1 hypothetical protein [Helicobacter ibis]